MTSGTTGFDGYARCLAPERASRLVPSRFPPVPAFDAVTGPEDLALVMELEGWTNDRLAARRLGQLDRADWVYGRPNASVVMAAFLHGSGSGLRFSGPTLGAWYAATEIVTAVLEVANGLRRELSLTGLTRKIETYREYTARMRGDFLDIFDRHPEFHDPDEASYPAPQRFGATLRDLGPAAGLVGLRYQSVRRPGHENWVCFRPRSVQDVTQARHYEIDVPATGKVAVRRLDAGSG